MPVETTTIRCHVCDGTDHRPYGSSGRNRIVVCRECGLFFVNPVPTPDALRRMVSEAETYTEDQLAKVDFFRRRATRLFDTVESRITPGSVLDIGCAIGTELVVARERGWTATGIELSEASVRVAREHDLDVRACPLEDAGFADASFDLVTANHVVEHLAWPITFFAELHRILDPSGYLFVSVPNVDAWKRYLLRSRYRWTFHDDHFAHYSKSTLPRLLQRHGFEVVSIHSSRAYDFHQDIETRSRLFRWCNAKVEALDMGIELFCLARPM
ncbi:MAG: class I SAM-dependent methyltransferase [Planctomycetes bacterium]|nr:class I SAM-dependent methyltransferase [Planctomycetota bacterium]